ncbi:MAG: ribose 5-phosphate isomerase B [Deltaproteobacteria bacterium]|nr:MAG: ribose 5-phosphate isomerase B [Deltaproteobacteria bacterium]
MKIAIGCDHAGFELKEDLRVYLRERGVEVLDLGTPDGAPVDYPEIGIAVAEKVSTGAIPRGILICGTGIGMSVVANRFRGVRATLCHDLYTARMSREHNDSNVLVLGGRLLGKGIAREIVGVWLEAEFLGGNHQRRLDQIARLDEKCRKARGASRKEKKYFP